MLCKKCKKEIPDGSLFCNHCGRKQTVTAAKHRKRAHGTGTIRKDTRYKNPYIAIAPSSTNGAGRTYIGSYPDMKSAQAALDDFIRNGRPQLYGATLVDVYRLWSDIHFREIRRPEIMRSMWKWFSPLYDVRMADLRTAHFQEIINKAKTESTADKLKSLAVMLCRYALENDIVSKNYAEFVRIPRFEKNEKVIFSPEQISILWQHTDDIRVQAILTMIYMGFRLGEIVSLTADNVHLDEGYVVGGIKTRAGIDRVIPLPPNIPEIRAFFAGWLESCQDGYIIPVNEKNFRDRWFYPALRELNIIECEFINRHWKFPDKHHLTPHSTRHTFASLSSSAGMRPENLQKIIGHADYSTTADIYIHKDISELIDEMSKLKK